MERRSTWWLVYGVSALVHGGLALGATRVEPRPPAPPPPIVISVAEPPPPAEPPPEPEPEPEPEEPEPEPEPAKPEPKPEPRPVEKPRPEPEPAEAAEPAGEIPEFGVQMEGGVGPGGTAVPTGDPSGAPRNGPPKVVKKARVVAAAKPKAAAEPACADPQTKPKPLSMPQPQYTDAARAAGIQGKVRVQITVDESGAITAVKVLESLDPGLDDAAKAAVQAAKFEPATRCGKPVSATFTISVRFSL